MAQLFFLSGRAWTDSSGAPYPAAVAHFYVPGTTTNQDSYTSASLAVANANPVVSDASTGIFPEIHFAAKRYKCVIKDASGNTLKTFEVIDATSQLIAASSAPSPTYPFLRYHNTTDGHVYRRNAADDAWIDEGAVDSLLNAASVTETLAGTATDKATTPDSVAGLWQRGTNITPSGGTVTLPSTGGGVFNIAAGNFSAISSAQGGRTVKFVHGGASVITHNATSMICLGGASITTEAGDISEWTNEAAADASGSNWRMTNWEPNELRLITAQIATQAQQETGTSTEVAVTPGRQHFHDSSLKAWMAFDGTGTPSATDRYNFATGSSAITDNGAGDYTLDFTTALSTAAGYAVAGLCNQASAGNTSANHMQVQGASAGNVLGASCRITSGNANTGTPGDENYNGVMFAGDI